LAKRKRTPAELEKFTQVVQKHMDSEKRSNGGLLAEVILGGQDGLVNVLGIVLGVASATNDKFLVLIAGLVATFGESISMAAVAYASARAEEDHYARELKQEQWEMDHLPEVEEEEIRLIYMKKGYRGKELAQMVKNTVSNPQMWLEVMMREEVGLIEPEPAQPIKFAGIVGMSAFIGSVIPLIPFMFFGTVDSIIVSLVLSTLVLFGVGVYKAKITVGNWFKSGLEMAVVGMLAAFVGYIVGKLAAGFFGLKSVPS
jgi:VIT1/CCC1 family predicted Fe2+/Mn2+ transporter